MCQAQAWEAGVTSTFIVSLEAQRAQVTSLRPNVLLKAEAWASDLPGVTWPASLGH